jgi:hypothetical protein
MKLKQAAFLARFLPLEQALPHRFENILGRRAAKKVIVSIGRREP